MEVLADKLKYTNKESIHSTTLLRFTQPSLHDTLQVAQYQFPQLMQGWLCEMLQCCGKCSPCLCTLSASASIQPPIPTFGRFRLEIFLNFLCQQENNTAYDHCSFVVIQYSPHSTQGHFDTEQLNTTQLQCSLETCKCNQSTW